MHRIDGPGHLSNQFTEGDPQLGQAPTTVTDDWLNDVQENLAQAIEGSGLALVKGSGSQLLEAVRRLVSENYYRGRELRGSVRPVSGTLDVFGIAAPTEAGTLDIPLIQTCEQGSTDWIEPEVEGQPEPEHPAPALHLKPAGGAPQPVGQAIIDHLFSEDESGRITAALGAAYVPDGFSGQPVALEQFWYVLPEFRKTRAGLNVFFAFENTARFRQVKRIVMVHLAALAPEKMQAFYESQGYRMVEQTFWKEL